MGKEGINVATIERSTAKSGSENRTADSQPIISCVGVGVVWCGVGCRVCGVVWCVVCGVWGVWWEGEM